MAHDESQNSIPVLVEAAQAYVTLGEMVRPSRTSGASTPNHLASNPSHRPLGSCYGGDRRHVCSFLS